MLPMLPTPPLAAILTLGLFAAGLALILRAVAPQPWLLHKPLSCDLCMSWWGSVVGAAVRFGGAVGVDSDMSLITVAPAVVAAVAVSVVVLKSINRLDVL